MTHRDFAWFSTKDRSTTALSLRPRPYYSVTLETLQDQEWSTVRSWDNSHDREEHYLHRYTKTGGREDPELLAHPSIQIAMAHAFADAARSWEAILRSWER